MGTKEAKADVQNQDKVDKQKSETKSAPKKKTPVKRKQSKSQVAVKKEKVAKMSENGPAAVASTSELCKKGDTIPVGTEKLVPSPYNSDITTKSKVSPVVT
jgi:hypothetical protein